MAPKRTKDTAERIVKALANGRWNGDKDWGCFHLGICPTCGESSSGPDRLLVVSHKRGCIWLRARRLTRSKKEKKRG